MTINNLKIFCDFMNLRIQFMADHGGYNMYTYVLAIL